MVNTVLINIGLILTADYSTEVSGVFLRKTYLPEKAVPFTGNLLFLPQTTVFEARSGLLFYQSEPPTVLLIRQFMEYYHKSLACGHLQYNGPVTPAF